MGHTKSISDLKKDNQEFSDYLDQCTANLKKSASGDMTEFNSGTDTFYSKNSWDKQKMASGEHYDYKQIDEFSLDTIINTVQSVAKGVFGGGTMPDGSTLDDVEEGAKIMASILSFEVLATNAALSLIENVLGVFATRTSLTYTSTINRQSLAPGLTLHLFTMTAGFNQKNYFNNKTIVEDVFSYELIYSFAEAAVQQDINYMNDHEELIEKAEKTREILQDKYDNMITDPDVTDEKLDSWQKRIDRITTQIENYRTEVQKIKDSYQK